LVEVGVLGQQGLEKFFELAGCGTGTRSLADGEASTLAFAWERGFAAVVDEKKALRICTDCLPTVLTATTIDILSLEAVKLELKDDFHSALLNALQLGRMRVPSHQVEWIIKSIGREHAEACVSLSRALAGLAQTVA
jgi:predicted nucleic acid-binding protein